MAKLNFNMDKINEMTEKFTSNETKENVFSDLEELNNQFSSMCEDWALLNNEQREEQKVIYVEAQLAIHELGTKYAAHLLKPNKDSEQEMDTSNETTGKENPNAENPIGEEKASAANIAIDKIVPISQNRLSWSEMAEQEERQGIEPQQLALQTQLNSAQNQGAKPRSYSEVTVHGDQPTSEIQYRVLYAIVKIVFDFQPIQNVSKAALNEVLEIIDIVQKRAEHIKYDINNNKTMIACIHSKLDSISKRLFGWDSSNIEPNLNVLLQFLTKRAKTFTKEEEILSNKTITNFNPPPRANTESDRASIDSSVQKRLKIVCIKCQGEHFLYNCEEFKALPLEEKQELVNNAHICHNCFSPTHPTTWCLKGNCKKCNVRHNSLLCPNGYSNTRN